MDFSRVWRHTSRLCKSFAIPVALLSFTHTSNAASPDTFVHLFEWKWNDIANECEYLGKKGYKAVQISPPAEHAAPTDNRSRTWWIRYQTVSYKNFTSHSGTESELKNMISTCQSHGVDIYVDAVFNQMANYGNNGNGAGKSSAGRDYDSKSFNYPDVQGKNIFNEDKCTTSIDGYGDAEHVRSCKLSGMPDIDQSNNQAQDMIVAYLNRLTDMGVKGFRIDAAKHMWPGDLSAIYSQLNGNPFIFQEVLDAQGEASGIHSRNYTQHGSVTNIDASKAFRLNYKHSQPHKAGGEIDNNSTPSDKSVLFIDNHDNQRGHAVAQSDIFNFTDDAYSIATMHMLAYPYGYPKVMSSFNFYEGSTLNDNKATPTSSPHSACKSNNHNEWICEHRREEIANMVYFRQDTDGEPIKNYTNEGNNKLAFSRGNKGFIAINNDQSTWQQTFDTNLPAGTYCDVGNATFDYDTKACSGNTVNVNNAGEATISIKKKRAAVIYSGSKLCESDEACDVTPTTPTPNPSNPSQPDNTIKYTYPVDDNDLETMHVRGVFNDWGNTAMVYRGNNIWTAQVNFDNGDHQNAGRCFKFDITGNWDPAENFGVSDENACSSGNYRDFTHADSAQGSNIPAPSGTWVVAFDESSNAYSFEDPATYDPNPIIKQPATPTTPQTPEPEPVDEEFPKANPAPNSPSPSNGGGAALWLLALSLLTLIRRKKHAL